MDAAAIDVGHFVEVGRRRGGRGAGSRKKKSEAAGGDGVEIHAAEGGGVVQQRKPLVGSARVTPVQRRTRAVARRLMSRRWRDQFSMSGWAAQ